jgi:hypothetical protein
MLNEIARICLTSASYRFCVKRPSIHILHGLVDLELKHDPVKRDLRNTLYKICIQFARVEILARNQADLCKLCEFGCVCCRFSLFADLAYMKLGLGAGITHSRGVDELNGAVGVQCNSRCLLWAKSGHY